MQTDPFLCDVVKKQDVFMLGRSSGLLLTLTLVHFLCVTFLCVCAERSMLPNCMHLDLIPPYCPNQGRVLTEPVAACMQAAFYIDMLAQGHVWNRGGGKPAPFVQRWDCHGARAASFTSEKKPIFQMQIRGGDQSDPHRTIRTRAMGVCCRKKMISISVSCGRKP